MCEVKKNIEFEKRKISGKKRIYVMSEMYDDRFTVEEFKHYIELTKDMQMSILFNSILDYEEVHFSALSKILNNKEYENAAKRMVNILGMIDEFVADSLLAELDNYEFIKFINLLEKRVLNNKEIVFNFIDRYKSLTKIKNWDKSSELLSNLYMDHKNYDLEDIFDYEEKRNEYYQDKIKNGHYNPKDIAISYFQKPLVEIKAIADCNKIYNEFTMFDELTDVCEQLEFIEKASKNKNYFNNLKLELKNKSLEDFQEKLKFNVTKENEIIKYDGQDFLFLIHAVTGMLQVDITNKILEDMTNWSSNYEDNGYISCSLINQLYISFVASNQLTLGFNNIKKDDILAMNTHDMYFLKKQIVTNLEDNSSNYLTTDNLLANSYSNYNEVVLRRYRDKEAIMPDYLLSFNKISEETEKASKDLSLPIYLLNLEKYALLFIKELNILKNSDEKKYVDYVKRLRFSANLRNEPLNKYYEIIKESDALVTENEEACEYIKNIK